MNLWVGTNIQTTANSKTINTRSVPAPEAWSTRGGATWGAAAWHPERTGEKGTESSPWTAESWSQDLPHQS